jgi:hypothetical protein
VETPDPVSACSFFLEFGGPALARISISGQILKQGGPKAERSSQESERKENAATEASITQTGNATERTSPADRPSQTHL